MNQALSAIFWGVLTFSVLILIHEGGHFLAARLFGVKVHEFMLGLPGPALRYRGKKTTYGVTAIPLGGYVKIAGMEPGPEDPRLTEALAAATAAGESTPASLASALTIEEEDASSLLFTLADWGALERIPKEERYVALYPTAAAENPEKLYTDARATTYRALPMWKRIVTLSAGVALNILTAILVFTVALSAYGSPEISLKLAGVTKNGAAAAAGIRAGDRILAIDGKTVATWDELVASIAKGKPGTTVVIKIERDGVRSDVEAVLGRGPKGNAFLGIEAGQEMIRMSVPAALKQSFVYLGMMFGAIANFFRPSTFQQSLDQSSSIIGASVIVAQAVEIGPWIYAQIVAILSLGLGVINILPIPPLDGGKVVLEIAEKAAGKPLPRVVVLGFSLVGAVLLFSLIGYLMYADTMRYIING
jgi:regulator of sigma E protease